MSAVAACNEVRLLSRLRGRVREGAMVEEPTRPVWSVSRAKRYNARRLRRDQTDAERLIWAALRAHRLNGASFRRQKPIGPYIVDFVCESARLIVEIDGGQHYEAAGVARDATRDAYLSSKGYRVLRFSNVDVPKSRSGVLETLISELDKMAPSPTLPRRRGRERILSGGNAP